MDFASKDRDLIDGGAEMALDDKIIYSASAYLIKDSEGHFLHRVRHGSFVWREDIRPYTVCQYKRVESAVRAIKRIGLGGKPIKATLSFKPFYDA